MSRSSASLLPLRIHPPPGRPTRVFAAMAPGELVGSLEESLGALCQEAAAVLAAEVVSVYGVEHGDDGDQLTVLGNVGFPREVVGNLRLRIGDGIVGWVAECLRPISLAAADRDPRFRAVRGIGEEHLPIMLALPILRHGRLLGVLAIQRAADEVGERELRLATLLAETAGLLLEAGARRGGGAELGELTAMSLAGEPASGGFGLGRVVLLPTAEALARADAPAPTGRAIGEALARLDRDVARMRLDLGGDAGVARALGRLELLLADERFRERALVAGGVPHGLAALARAYGRAPFQGPRAAAPDPAALDHASDVEELCVLLHLAATGSTLQQSGRVWMGDRLGAFFALAATRHAAAVVIDGDGAVTAEARAIARRAGLPVVAAVHGLYAWTRPGDLVLVEADIAARRGLVRVNPASINLAAARSRRER